MTISRRKFITGAATLAAGAAVLPSSAAPIRTIKELDLHTVAPVPFDPPSPRYINPIITTHASGNIEIMMGVSHDGINFQDVDDIDQYPAIEVVGVGGNCCNSL